MFFLLKCVFWLGLVFFLIDWPKHDAQPHSKAETTRTAARTEAQKPREAKRAAASAAAEDLGQTLTRAATDRLAEAAREHCLAKPADCLAVLGLAAPDKAPRAER